MLVALLNKQLAGLLHFGSEFKAVFFMIFWGSCGCCGCAGSWRQKIRRLEKKRRGEFIKMMVKGSTEIILINLLTELIIVSY